jgi:hypothetical protein
MVSTDRVVSEGLAWDFWLRPEQCAPITSAPRAGFEPAAYCLGGTSEQSPDGAWGRLMCYLAAPIVAGRRPTSPCAAGVGSPLGSPRSR